MQVAGLILALPAAVLAQTDAAPAADAGPRFTAEQIAQGRAQYDRTCAQCHGRNMVNAGTTVYDLRKFPVDQLDRFQTSVTAGKGNMPSFKDALSAEQISALWAYVGSRGGKQP
jgi:cytochrome c6